MRARNRPFNRGLRIDLTLISDSAKHLVQDTYVLDQEEAYVGLSDHVPCGVSLGGELATF
jgi:exonuclease III